MRRVLCCPRWELLDTGCSQARSIGARLFDISYRSLALGACALSVPELLVHPLHACPPTRMAVGRNCRPNGTSSLTCYEKTTQHRHMLGRPNSVEGCGATDDCE